MLRHRDVFLSSPKYGVEFSTGTKDSAQNIFRVESYELTLCNQKSALKSRENILLRV
jgi:hypothetical protein